MSSRTPVKTASRTKKSFTLSPQSVSFLESLQKKRVGSSVSAILEEILQAARRDEKRASIDQAISSYYDSLTDEELREHAEWGEFGLRQMR